MTKTKGLDAGLKASTTQNRLFQQPLKPCPFKSHLRDYLQSPPGIEPSAYIKRAGCCGHTVHGGCQSVVEEENHCQRFFAEVVMNDGRQGKRGETSQYSSRDTTGESALRPQTPNETEQKHKVGHGEPQPRHKGWYATLDSDLKECRMEVALHVVLNESADVPFAVMHAHRFHSHTEPGVLAHQPDPVLPHQNTKVRANVLAVHPLDPPGMLNPEDRPGHYGEEDNNGRHSGHAADKHEQ